MGEQHRHRHVKTETEIGVMQSLQEMLIHQKLGEEGQGTDSPSEPSEEPTLPIP